MNCIFWAAMPEFRTPDEQPAFRGSTIPEEGRGSTPYWEAASRRQPRCLACYSPAGWLAVSTRIQQQALKRANGRRRSVRSGRSRVGTRERLVRPAREATGSMAGPSVARVEENGPLGYRGKPVFFSGRTGRSIRRQTRRLTFRLTSQAQELGLHEEITCMAVLSAGRWHRGYRFNIWDRCRSAESPPHCSAFDTQP